MMFGIGFCSNFASTAAGLRGLDGQGLARLVEARLSGSGGSVWLERAWLGGRLAQQSLPGKVWLAEVCLERAS